MKILEETNSELSVLEMLRFLYRYGYFTDLVDDLSNKTFADIKKTIKAKMPEFKQALRLMQAKYGLEVTGDPDPETQHAMIEPRCGYPDIVPAGAEAAGQCRWPIENMEAITFSSRLDQLVIPFDIATGLFKEAGRRISEKSAAQLRYTDDFGNANINAGTKRIDTAGRTLAYSFLPCQNSARQRLEQQYDTSERWSQSMLLAVIIHELLHALGFHHASIRASILFPSYQPDVLDLTDYDNRRLVDKYGRRLTPPDPGDEPGDPGEPGGEFEASGRIQFIYPGGKKTLKLISITDHGEL